MFGLHTPHYIHVISCVRFLSASLGQLFTFATFAACACRAVDFFAFYFPSLVLTSAQTVWEGGGNPQPYLNLLGLGLNRFGIQITRHCVFTGV